jgi:ketosteroid isomerase-like protein
MKTIQLLIILSAFSCFNLSAYAQAIPDDDWLKLKKEFQNETEKWKDAYNSNDAQNLVHLYSEEAMYISSHVVGLEANGREKLIANFQNGMNMGGHIDSVEVLTMNVSCELATLLCKYQATNNGVTVTGRNLLVMKKLNGKWLIVLHMTVV